MNTQMDSGHVLVGVDGSEYSSNALKTAGRLADALRAPIEVITCVGMSDFYLASHLEPGIERFTEQLQETAARLAEDAVERAFGQDRPEALTVSVKFGAPAKVLIDESRNARLLVVGRRGGGFFAQPIGSVSRACAAHAHCPVLVVDQETLVVDQQTSAD